MGKHFLGSAFTAMIEPVAATQAILFFEPENRKSLIRKVVLLSRLAFPPDVVCSGRSLL